MANRIRVELDGMDELMEKLASLDLDAQDVLEAAVLAAGQLVAEAARPKAPGPEIETALNEKESTPKKIVVDVGPDDEKWYYRFLETGATAHEIDAGAGALLFEGRAGLVITKSVDHPGFPARPFLRPALDENQDQARDAIGEQIKRVIDDQAE